MHNSSSILINYISDHLFLSMSTSIQTSPSYPVKTLNGISLAQETGNIPMALEPIVQREPDTGNPQGKTDALAARIGSSE